MPTEMPDPTTDPSLAAAEALLPRLDAAVGLEAWMAVLPGGDEAQRDLAPRFEAIAASALAAGRLERASVAAWAGFLLRLEVAKRAPDDPIHVGGFAGAEHLMARVLIAMGKLGRARELLDEALGYRRGLLRDDPGSVEAWGRCVQVLWTMAELEQACGDGTAERACLSEARDLLDALQARNGGEDPLPSFRAMVGEALAALGV